MEITGKNGKEVGFHHGKMAGFTKNGDLTEKYKEVKQEEMVELPGKEMNLRNNDPRIIFMMLPLLWRSKYPKILPVDE